MCDVGEYRSNCTAAADGLCVPCTNTTLPANTVFASAGQPYNRDACAIRCADGMYPTKDLASAAASNSEASVCQPCNNTKPPNAIYSGPSHLINVPWCPWACDEGFAQDGSICVRLNGTCTMEKCPLPRLEYRPSTQSVILVNSCYEWQYPECNGDEIVGCNDCMGVSSSFQGGFHLRAYESCGIGYYRAPCVNRCVFPKGGNIRGQCVPCTNAQTMHANYTSAGTELVSNAAPWYGTLNNCSFTCLNGYVRHGNQCVAS